MLVAPQRQIVALASTTLLLLLFSGSGSAWGNPQVRKGQQAQRKCEPIGRVLSEGDRKLKKGSLLCQGDYLHPSRGETIKILCYLNQKVLQLSEGVVSDRLDKCVSKTQIEQCTPQDRSNCPKPKAPGANAQIPTLISPYSSAIINPRPSLSWYEVKQATTYTVSVEGAISWSKQVKGTTLAYPPQQEAMQPGNVYQVNIIANKGNSPISASSAVLVMLPSVRAQQVMATVEQINKLKLSADEQARDLDSAYMSQNLLTEAINVLKARIDAGTTNPTLHRLLGDRYLEAGFPLDAKQAYTQAAFLAVGAKNANELAAAQAGLERAQGLSK